MINKEEVLAALNFENYYRSELADRELKPEKGGEYKTLCPFHDDGEPSLNINFQTGFFYCHGCDAGGDVFRFHQLKHKCDFPEALKELATIAGVSDNGRKEIAATYDYRDPTGNLLFQVVKFKPKTFRQRRPDGNGGYIWNLKGVELVPYRLPEVLKAQTIFVCEGEKDCDQLAKLGLTATCNSMGAGKWRTSYNRFFKDKEIIILPDNDKPGLDHAHDVAQQLAEVAASVKVVRLPGLPEKGDITDWLNQGGTIEKLLELCHAAPDFYDYLEREAIQGEVEVNENPFPEVISGPELEKKVFPDVKFTVPGIMPTGFGLLAARPKKGKSFLGLNISVALATGGCALGKKELTLERGKVLYLAYEDKFRRVKNRLTSIMQDAPFPKQFNLAETWPKFSDGGLDKLNLWLTYNPDTKLIVIDTLGRFKDRKKAKDDPYESEMALGGALADLANKHSVTILAIYHNRKMEAENPLDDVYGSTGLTAAADFIMVMRRGKGQADAELYVTGREIEEVSLALKFHRDIGCWELLGTAEEVNTSEARKEIIELLKENGPLTGKEVSEYIGKKLNTVIKLLHKMKVSREIERDKKKYYVIC